MAKNYQAREAYKIVTEYASGENRTKESLSFLSRYPAFASAIQNKDIEKILNAIPYASARQMEKGLRGGIEISDVEDDAECETEAEVAVEPEPEPEPVKAKRTRKTSEPKTEPLPEPEPAAEADAEEDDDAEDNGKYSGMKPRALYDMCIKAGLKAKPQQEASYYIEKLEYVDKKAAEDAAAKASKKKVVTKEDSKDDWDEDEDDKPAKVGKPKDKGAKAKDDDWDF